MAKEDETPRTNPAEIENLIKQIRGMNLEPGAKEKIERLLRTVLTLNEACSFFRTEVRADRLIRSLFNLLESSFKTRPTSEVG
jgi:hypothetical protein